MAVIPPATSAVRRTTTGDDHWLTHGDAWCTRGSRSRAAVAHDVARPLQLGAAIDVLAVSFGGRPAVDMIPAD